MTSGTLSALYQRNRNSPSTSLNTQNRFAIILFVNSDLWKENEEGGEWERETEKESETFTSSRTLLWRGDLRGTLSHQNNTLRGAKARFSYRLGFLSLLWRKKRGWRGMGIRKNDCKGGMGEGAGHYQEGHSGWTASHTCCFSLALLSEVAIFALFQCFSIFQHFWSIYICYIYIYMYTYIYIYVYIYIYIYVSDKRVTGLRSTSCWPGMMWGLSSPKSL
jgi:hypothetical protein